MYVNSLLTNLRLLRCLPPPLQLLTYGHLMLTLLHGHCSYKRDKKKGKWLLSLRIKMGLGTEHCPWQRETHNLLSFGLHPLIPPAVILPWCSMEVWWQGLCHNSTSCCVPRDPGERGNFRTEPESSVVQDTRLPSSFPIRIVLVFVYNWFAPKSAYTFP